MLVRLSARAALLALAAVACRPSADKTLDVPSASAATADTMPSAPAPSPVIHPDPEELPPVADSVARSLVFAPRNQRWFTAAARGKRMLVDIGRVDLEVRQDSARKRAFRDLVERRAPLRHGQRLRLRSPWGAEDVTVGGYDSWNGRIVAILHGSSRLDSLVRAVEPLPASVTPADSSTATAPDSCRRDSIPGALLERAEMVRDSIDLELRMSQMPVYERLAQQVNVASTQVPGCFGDGRLLLIVSLRAGDNEYVRESYVVLDDSGGVHPLVRGLGYRFKAHDAIYAFDADGDGVDDVAVKGMAQRSGGTVLLRLDPVSHRLERLTGGFVWEGL